MFRGKYSKLLTILLIVLIIAIIVVAIIIAINSYKNYMNKKEKENAFAELIEQAEEENKNAVVNNNSEGLLTEEIDTNTLQNQPQTISKPKAKFYKDYPMIGYIKIEKTNTEYPILLDVSPAALDVAVGVMYPSNPTLNEPGNTVIIGHNYRDGRFFANNNKLSIGDSIKITDLNGKTLTYRIYDISTIPDTETEYVTRDRQNNTEISLSTCTDDGKARLVILAKAE